MCTGTGYEWSDLELSKAINDRVSAVLFDDEGRHDVEELLSGIIETEFEGKKLTSYSRQSETNRKMADRRGHC